MQRLAERRTTQLLAEQLGLVLRQVEPAKKRPRRSAAVAVPVTALDDEQQPSRERG